MALDIDCIELGFSNIVAANVDGQITDLSAYTDQSHKTNSQGLVTYVFKSPQYKTTLSYAYEKMRVENNILVVETPTKAQV